MNTMFKKIYTTLALTLCLLLQAEAQTFTPAENINPSTTYSKLVVIDDNSRNYTLSFQSNIAAIKSLLGVSDSWSGELRPKLLERWFVRKKGVSDFTPDSGFGSAFSLSSELYGVCRFNDNNGYIWLNYNSTWVNDNQYWSATFTAPEGVDMSEYEVVCLLTDDYSVTLTNYVPSAITENSVKAAVVYSFITDAETADLFVPGDETSAEVINFSQVGGSTATINLYADDLANGRRLSTLANNLYYSYIRWYILDKEGNQKKLSSSPFTPASGTDDYDYRSEGLIYDCSTASKKLADNQWNPNEANRQLYLNNIGVTLSEGDKVVCLVSDESPERIGTYGITEPTFDLKYVYTFRTEEEILADYVFPDLSDQSTIKINTDEYVCEPGQSVTIDLYNYNDQIFSDCGSTGYVNNISILEYLHFYFIDKEGNPVTTIDYNGLIGYDTSNHFNESGRNVINGSHGLYAYSTDPQNGAKLFHTSFSGYPNQAKFTISAPADMSLADLRLVIVATDEVEGIELFNASHVIANPTRLKSAYIITFNEPAFRHYEGYANAPGEWKEEYGHKYQLVHEYAYRKYVGPGQTIVLRTPVDEADAVLEYRAYYRWYDYKTDSKSIYLTTSPTEGSKLVDYPSAEKSAGLMIYNFKDIPNYKICTAVNFTAPSEWVDGQGEIIACDASRYADGLDANDEYLVHEPTLSTRFMYYVYPATTIANNLKNAIAQGGGNVYENHGYVSLGALNDNTVTNLRLDLQYVSDYYFYNYKWSDSAVPATATATDILAQFDGELCHATRVIWRVFDASGNYYRDIDASRFVNHEFGGRMVQCSIQALNSGEWKLLEGVTVTEPGHTPADFSLGDIAYVVAYVADESGNKCPVARFSCQFHANSYPKLFSELDIEDEHRTISYLDANFRNVAVVSFDNDNDDVTLAAPTNPGENMTRHPSMWERRNYGFVYYELYDRMVEHEGNIGGGTSTWPQGLSPLHGDYGVYKTMNVPDISAKDTESQGYYHRWWDNSELHDRTYQMTNGSQHGYFLYVDASHEARQIGEAAFEGDLCPGSIIVISAAVANMTDGSKTAPQLMFKLYGIDDDGTRHLIHTFASGNFSTVGADEHGKWYQVYARSSLHTGTDVERFNQFVVTYDNYCEGTQGSDYCVDDVRIYVRNSKVDALQSNPMCEGDQSASIKLRAHYESLVAWMGGWTGWNVEAGGDPGHKNLYWRVMKVDASGNESVVTGIYGGESRDYGKSVVYRVPAKETDDGKKEYDEFGELYYVINAAVSLPALKDGERYYVALARANDSDGSVDESTWSNPTDICSAYSDYFVPLGQGIEIMDASGNVLSNFPLQCNQTETDVTLTASLTVPDPVHGGSISLSAENVKFDWFVIKDGDEGNKIQIGTNINPATFKYVEDTHLSADGYLHLRLVPVTTQVTVNGVTMTLCTDDIDIALKATYGGPVLNLGFWDVNYPNPSAQRTVRLGMEQLKNMKSGSQLVIPVHSFKSMTEGNTDFTLKVGRKDPSGSETAEPLTVSDTNDPTCQVGTPVAEVVSLAEKALTLKFTDVSVFHEGYWYELNFQIYEEQNGSNPCYADVFFTSKVVPEFVTWTGAGNNVTSTNWNNDLNWTRSKADYIYEPNDHTGAKYQDYGTADTEGLAHLQSYAPMKFTKVTIDPRIQSARLEQLVTNAEGIVNSGLLNREGHDATDDVEYDLMVQVVPNGNAYECEKWYGNTCKEIYFKPQAELRYQQYLSYEKAWVEYELKQNKWYMLTSPLKEVYAGDMYVPTTGRQETAAFTDITFNPTDYSRTTYPIYQRSWDNAESAVIAETGNYSAAAPVVSTEADGFTSQWSHTYNDVEVGYEPNGSYKNGFSLRAHRVDVDKAGKEKALIRLPKADTQYTYYNYKGELSGVSGSVTKNGGKNLLVDSRSDAIGTYTMQLDNDTQDNGIYIVSNPYMASIRMSRFFSANTGLEKKFWIISDGKMEVRAVTDEQDYTIAPTQSFFVKKAEESSPSEVTFTTNMIALTRVNLLTGAPAETAAKFTEAAAMRASIQEMAITAAYNGAQSTATVVLNDEADQDFVGSEDAEMLYDSNLAAVPTVYTVAGSQAVSINTVPELTVMPMGIVSASNVEAAVSFKGVSKMNTDVYLYDRATNTSTLLEDGMTLALATNEHGRYFFSNGDLTTGISNVEAEKGIKCYSPAPGMLTVTCLAGNDRIEGIELYSIDGKRLMSLRDLNSPSINLNTYKGIKLVVVKHTGSDEPETCKVAVK